MHVKVVMKKEKKQWGNPDVSLDDIPQNIQIISSARDLKL